MIGWCRGPWSVVDVAIVRECAYDQRGPRVMIRYYFTVMCKQWEVLFYRDVSEMVHGPRYSDTADERMDDRPLHPSSFTIPNFSPLMNRGP